jgi:hypothetical protein
MIRMDCGTVAPAGRALLGVVLLCLCWAAHPSASLAGDAGQRRGGGRKNAGRILVVDFADQTGVDDEPRLGGGTAGMGRFLRDMFAASGGGEAVDLETTLESLRRLDFSIDDCHDMDRVGALMDASGADRLLHGFIGPTGNPSVVKCETVLLTRDGGGIVTTSSVNDMAVTGDMELSRGGNYPPLSDNRPNTALPNHPLTDPDAPFRMEILDGNGRARELRIRNDRAYVAGGVGGGFDVRLINNSDVPAAVALFIDARPAASVGGEAFLPSASPKYVIPANSSEVISGWGDGMTPRFSFGRSANSDRLTRNYWDAVGVVSAAFYPMAPENTAVIWDIDGEDAWRAKFLPASGELQSSPEAGGARGRKSGIQHASSPGAILSVHYDASERVGKYRTLGR